MGLVGVRVRVGLVGVSEELCGASGGQCGACVGQCGACGGQYVTPERAVFLKTLRGDDKNFGSGSYGFELTKNTTVFRLKKTIVPNRCTRLMYWIDIF